MDGIVNIEPHVTGALTSASKLTGFGAGFQMPDTVGYQVSVTDKNANCNMGTGGSVLLSNTAHVGTVNIVPGLAQNNLWLRAFASPSLQVSLGRKLTQPVDVDQTGSNANETAKRSVHGVWILGGPIGSSTPPSTKPPAKKPCTNPPPWPTFKTAQLEAEYLGQVAQREEQREYERILPILEEEQKQGNALGERLVAELQAKGPIRLAMELEEAAEAAEKRAAREEIYECFSELRFETARGFDKFMPETPSPGVALHWSSNVSYNSIFNDVSTTGTTASDSSIRSGVSTTGTKKPVGSISADFTTTNTKALYSGQPFRLKVTIRAQKSGKTVGTATTTINVLGIPRPALISSVTFGGSEQNPSIVIHGKSLGTRPAPNPAGSPANRPLCPGAISGNAGLDYGTNLYLADTTANWAAGRYRPAANELDCIGLVVTKFTPTEVDYRLGGFYAQVYPKLALTVGDAVQVAVNGATRAVHVKYGATVSG